LGAGGTPKVEHARGGKKMSLKTSKKIIKGLENATARKAHVEPVKAHGKNEGTPNRGKGRRETGETRRRNISNGETEQEGKNCGETDANLQAEERGP